MEFDENNSGDIGEPMRVRVCGEGGGVGSRVCGEGGCVANEEVWLRGRCGREGGCGMKEGYWYKQGVWWSRVMS